MLRELRVRNLAVIESVTVQFEAGFNVLTGETGAGKSILIDAILLVRGGRAQADVIRADTETATVEAVFEPAGAGRLAELTAGLEEAGLSLADGQLVIRRELHRSGRHRAFVNDSPVTVALLERLGDHLVEVHGQHEHQRLLEPAAQLTLLDRFADAEDLSERLSGLFAKYRAAREDLERFRAAERDRAQREDLLRFQVSELAAARIRAGEEEELRTEQRRLLHAERFAAGLEEVTALLQDDDRSAAGRVARAARILRDLGRLDAAFAGPAELLDTVQAQIDEAMLALRGLRETVVVEPGRREAIDDRLDALTRLKRKYGDTEEALLEFHAAAVRELERLERGEEQLAAEEARVTDLSAELLAAAGTLSERRQSAAVRLQAEAQREVRLLGMERARFEIAVERGAPETVGARGLDRAEFRLAANPGEEMKPLARIASGGELSRTMLALQTVLASADAVPTVIFDEVDAGIGGRIAAVVGQKLAAAAAHRQVLCVTHLAQIAARSAHHLRVTKTVRAGRTRATVVALGRDDRVEETARMLAGEKVTEAARRHARELLGRGAGGA